MTEDRGRGELKIQQANNATVFTVKVVPRSSKTAIAGVLGEMLKIKLSAAPEKGKANEALIVFLAETLGVKKNAITITAGQTSPVKTIRITGISAEMVLQKLNQ
ncbi:MAG: DUF167 domain-containing protein [Sedimentisphaerales bacterium]|nr:DUF167 domain-containing protein [Sedimentisphaerales bacterium]